MHAHVLVHPFEFECAEVRADGQPRDISEEVLAAQLLSHPIAQISCAGIEPHNGVVQGLASVFVPHHCGLPLVGDAQGLDVDRADGGLGLLDGFADAFFD